MKNRRRMINTAFKISADMSMSRQSSAKGKKKRSQTAANGIEEHKQKHKEAHQVKTPNDYELETFAVYVSYFK